jgi:hypothetical protein
MTAMAETPIEPALTAEEWAHPPQPKALDWACWEVFIGAGESLNNVTRHGLAALCLYGQPFGFTHEELEAVRFTTVGFAGDPWGYTTGAERQALIAAHQRLLVSVAAKLAALLPPTPGP